MALPRVPFDSLGTCAFAMRAVGARMLAAALERREVVSRATSTVRLHRVASFGRADLPPATSPFLQCRV